MPGIWVACPLAKPAEHLPTISTFATVKAVNALPARHFFEALLNSKIRERVADAVDGGNQFGMGEFKPGE